MKLNADQTVDIDVDRVNRFVSLLKVILIVEASKCFQKLQVSLSRVLSKCRIL